MKITIKGQEIDLPEGSTLEVVDGEIIFTPKRDEFKDGDIIYWATEYQSGVFIFRRYERDGCLGYYAHFNLEQSSFTPMNRYIGTDNPFIELRKATSSEQKKMFDALEKYGKKWNPVKKCIEDITKPKEEFKDGDILHAYRYGFHYYCIYKSLKDDLSINYYALYNKTVGQFRYDDYCLAEGFSLATEKEKQMLFDALDKKEEKRWNPIIRKIEDLHVHCCVYLKEARPIADILKEMRGHVNKYPKSWEEIFIGKKMTGYWINGTSIIGEVNFESAKNYISVFKTEKQAKSALAYAQLTQLMALPCYNGNWQPDWTDFSLKHIIMRNSDHLDTSNSCITYSPIAFKTPGIRDAFLVNNQELLKQYFQL